MKTSTGLVGLLNLTKLQQLNLSGNYWLEDSSILAPIGELVSLQVLDLNFNQMGNLPVAAFGNLTNMRELFLSYNDFNGSLPKTLLILPHLKILDLSWNSLVGGIPISSSSDEEPASVEVLNLSNNKMSGALPTEQEFRYLRNIRELDLSLNQFSGNLSAFLFSLPHIEQLDLSGNLFEGPIPLSPSSNLSVSQESSLFSE